jgi:PAS domain S-box-containing protein
MPELATLARLPRWQRYWPIALGLYAIVGGAVSFAGWAADSPRLASWDGSGISIQPNATIAVMCAGVAVVLLATGYRRLSAPLGVLVTFIGATVLFEYGSGIDLGIDTVLTFGRPWGRQGVIFPGRMGPPGAVSWTLLGTAILLASLVRRPRGRWRAAAPVLALVSATIGSLSLIGYLYGASVLYTVPTATAIALQTSTFILACSIGFVFAVPDQQPMRLISENSPAGELIRRILPSLILIPVGLGLIRLAGERAGLYDLAFGTAARTMVEIALLSGLLWWSAHTISRQTEARRKAEERVIEHGRLLSTVTDEARVGLAIVSPEHRFVYANRTYCDIMSCTMEDIIGHRVADVLSDVYVEEVRPRLEQAFAGENVQYELNLPSIGRFAGVTYQPQSDGGLVTSVIAAVVDLTERRKVEEALEQSRLQLEADLNDSRLLQGISAEIIQEDDVQSLYEMIIDSAVTIMRSEYASLQMLAAQRDSESSGELRLLTYRGFPPQAAEFWSVVRANSHTTGGDALRSRARVVVPDLESSEAVSGTDDLEMFRFVGIRAVQSTPLISRSGKVLGMISTHWRRVHQPTDRELRLLDILARQAADLIERKQSEESLRHADRRKNEFLATLAHELRNPMAPVRNAVELMKRAKPVDPDLVRASEVIDRQVALMARLLDDLLDVGRITSDKLELRRQRVDLGSVVRSALEMCGPLIATFKHELSVSIPSEPIHVDADPARLGQVLGNLFNNACVYTLPKGYISVVLERSGSDALVTITDSGVGIPDDKLSSIFDMFSQVDHSPDHPHSGLGIGLHLVKRLVEMHGGAIEAQSDGPGEGSRFVVRLPALAASAQAEVPSPVPALPAASPSRRILVVDDNVDNAESLSILLEMLGNETHMARDGIEAVEAAAQLRPDVVLLDIGLPGLDGFEVCRRIREQPWGKDTLLVAITGWGQESDRRRSHEAGFDYHLVKPVDPHSIAALTKPSATVANSARL